jgi:hypothetical protein
MSNADPRSVSFSVEGVSGTVRPLRTTRDTMFRSLVLRKVTAGLEARGGEWAEIADRGIVEEYAQAVIVSTDVTGCPLPPIASSPAEHADGFERWLDLEPAQMAAWLEAMASADAPANAPELVPPVKLSGEKKETTPIAVLKNESA